MPAPSAARALQAVVAGALVATTLSTGPADARPAPPQRYAANPTGTLAGSTANGSGNLKVSLTSAPDGRIKVSWVRPAPVRKLRKWVVQVGPNRLLDSKVRSFKVNKKKQSILVPRTFGATTASGNYSFVKVTVYRTTGQHGSSPTKWIQAPLVSPCTAAANDQVTVGTFNVRSWAADGRKGTTQYNWNVRGDNAIREILRSGTRVFAAQEASGKADSGFGAVRQDKWILAKLNEQDLDLNANWVDALTDADYNDGGLVGTRIFYDASKFAKLSSGIYPIVVAGAAKALVPWVRLQAAGQAPFVMTSIHLDVGEAVSDFEARGRQVVELISIANRLRSFGDQVFLAGDLNSTSNTKPYNNVQLELLNAGAYDSFASADITNAQFGTTNSYNFPVRPTPYRRDYIMSLGAVTGSCGYTNLSYTQAADVASDHFMQVATMPLPPA